jgi:hypothetical protein
VGLVVKNIKSPQPTWDGSVSDLLTGSYMIQVLNSKTQALIGQTKFVKL